MIRTRSRAARRAAVLGAVAGLLFVAACGGSSGSRPSAVSVVTGSQPPAGTGSAPSTGGAGGSPQPAATPAPAPGSALMDLFPFKDAADAAAWQQSFRSGGHEPWHLDTGQTALSFTQGYLGFQNVDTVTSTQVEGLDAHVGVGYKPEGAGKLFTAAVLHLHRLGTGRDAPWEVVGSADSTLTIPQPQYGGRVSSPITAGGLVTGVDESLHVKVLGLAAAGVVGDKCCVPAGGERQPWTATVPFTDGVDQVLTVVVATGGHVAAVERFAITGVRTG